MSELDPQGREATGGEEADQLLDRRLKLSDLEVQRRLSRDYASELLARFDRKELLEAPEPGTIISCVGLSGTGKSTFLKACACGWLAEGKVVRVWDYLDEWSIFGVERTDTEGRHLRMLGPLRHRYTSDELLERDDLDELLQSDESFAVVPSRRGAKGRSADFRDLVDDLGVDDQEREREDREGVVRAYIFIVEETWQLLDDCHAQFKALSGIGRHSGLSVVASSQFTTGIPHEIRRQSRTIVAHLQDDDLDIDRLAKRMGKERAEQVRQLADYERIIHHRQRHRAAKERVSA